MITHPFPFTVSIECEFALITCSCSRKGMGALMRWVGQGPHLWPFAFAFDLLVPRSSELFSVSDVGDAERPASEDSLKDDTQSICI